ncbi:MAG TPA: citramalate synthase [Chloroflexota bacterium]
MSGSESYPSITINDLTMREGMQIERADIPTAAKIELLNALSQTGLRSIEVGSFVSPKWVPQMANIDEVIAGFTPMPGVRYIALAMNDKGVERYQNHVPPLEKPTSFPRTIVHLCDVFVRRNLNRSQDDEIAAWDTTVARAVADGATEAGIGINAAWGSNWLGKFSLDQRMAMLERQHVRWTDAGIQVRDIFIGDPMGWNVPADVEEQLVTIRQRWPGIRSFQLHLHNTRGMAVLSAYCALRVLDSSCRLVLDTSLGGMAGCPYCGNGRAASLPPTEDVVQLLEAEGVCTGIDLRKLVNAVVLAERVVGHPLYGHVSKGGWLPGPDDLYPMDMPLVETLEQAAHFRLGPAVYAGAPRPWRAPIQSAARHSG